MKHRIHIICTDISKGTVAWTFIWIFIGVVVNVLIIIDRNRQNSQITTSVSKIQKEEKSSILLYECEYQGIDKARLDSRDNTKIRKLSFNQRVRMGLQIRGNDLVVPAIRNKEQLIISLNPGERWLNIEDKSYYDVHIVKCARDGKKEYSLSLVQPDNPPIYPMSVKKPYWLLKESGFDTVYLQWSEFPEIEENCDVVTKMEIAHKKVAGRLSVDDWFVCCSQEDKLSFFIHPEYRFFQTYVIGDVENHHQLVEFWKQQSPFPELFVRKPYNRMYKIEFLTTGGFDQNFRLVPTQQLDNEVLQDDWVIYLPVAWQETGILLRTVFLHPIYGKCIFLPGGRIKSISSQTQTDTQLLVLPYIQESGELSVLGLEKKNWKLKRLLTSVVLGCPRFTLDYSNQLGQQYKCEYTLQVPSSIPLYPQITKPVHIMPSLFEEKEGNHTEKKSEIWNPELKMDILYFPYICFLKTQFGITLVRVWRDPTDSLHHVLRFCSTLSQSEQGTIYWERWGDRAESKWHTTINIQGKSFIGWTDAEVLNQPEQDGFIFHIKEKGQVRKPLYLTVIADDILTGMLAQIHTYKDIQIDNDDGINLLVKLFRLLHVADRNITFIPPK